MSNKKPLTKKLKSSKKTPRKTHQKKPATKGLKSLSGQPEIYDECKKKATISITPTGLAGLDQLSQEQSLSRSELVEQIGRGLIQLSGTKTLASKPELDSSDLEFDSANPTP